jgi:hypothetical protein
MLIAKPTLNFMDFRLAIASTGRRFAESLNVLGLSIYRVLQEAVLAKGRSGSVW